MTADIDTYGPPVAREVLKREVLRRVGGGYGHRTTKHLAAVTGLTESKVRRYLDELENAGLVEPNRRGKQMLLWKITATGKATLRA